MNPDEEMVTLLSTQSRCIYDAYPPEIDAVVAERQESNRLDLTLVDGKRVRRRKGR
jgi:hypothetical protein